MDDEAGYVFGEKEATELYGPYVLCWRCDTFHRPWWPRATCRLTDAERYALERAMDEWREAQDQC